MKNLFLILLPLLFSACSNTGITPESGSFPIAVPATSLTTNGELGHRLQMNFNRMEEAKYRPDSVFLTNEESHWWPGDTEGRTVLALTHLAQSTGRSSRFLEEILEDFPAHLNRKGYFGDIHPDGVLDEQQLSSHGWVLRGLCEYYDWKGDEKVLGMIQGMVDSLVVPTAGFHRNYPIDPEAREKGKGSFIGSRDFKMLNNWILSTDIGCDFIFMDGVIHAFAVTGDEDLKPVIEEMIAVFLSIDLVEIKAQTHATLTGIRALLRYFALTGREELLEAAVERFELYKKQGMTENYENYNWFGRPTHTEPCAIHDSYMAAKQLWQFSGKGQYLEDAEQIYYNGIGATQRSNGGFGCNSCSGAGDHFLGMRIYEAHWCCTMRGGEGLSYAARTAFYTHGSTIYLSSYGTRSLELSDGKGTLILKQFSNYPFGERMVLEVEENSLSGDPEVMIFAPSYLEDYHLTVNGGEMETEISGSFIRLGGLRRGDRVELSFSMKKGLKKAMNPNSLEGTHTLRYGPLVLTGDDVHSSQALQLEGDVEIEYLEGTSFLVNGIPFTSAWHLMEKRMDDPELSRQIMF